MRKEWVLLNADGTQVNHLVEYLGIEAFLAKLLVNRGITDVTEALKYLNPRSNTPSRSFPYERHEESCKNYNRSW